MIEEDFGNTKDKIKSGNKIIKLIEIKIQKWKN